MKKVIFIVLLFALIGCKADEDRRKQTTERNWKKSELGINYFIECIEGHKFIITHGTRGYGAAGPIGEC